MGGGGGGGGGGAYFRRGRISGTLRYYHGPLLISYIMVALNGNS